MRSGGRRGAVEGANEQGGNLFKKSALIVFLYQEADLARGRDSVLWTSCSSDGSWVYFCGPPPVSPPSIHQNTSHPLPPLVSASHPKCVSFLQLDNFFPSNHLIDFFCLLFLLHLFLFCSAHYRRFEAQVKTARARTPSAVPPPAATFDKTLSAFLNYVTSL